MEYELLSKLYYKDPENYERMYKQRFENEFAIKIPILIHNNQAFFNVSMSMLNKTVTLHKMLRKIETIKLPKIAFNSFITNSLMDEISLTNDIEGVSSTRKEIEEAVLNHGVNKKARFKGLATKYKMLIRNKEIPLDTCEDIRKLYDDIVLGEIEQGDKPDGKIFRKEIVHVVSSTQKEKHRGVMPEDKIIEYMNCCLDFIKNDKSDMLIKIASFHYLFGYIHPFYDGNGRTVRFISSYLLKDELGVLLSLRLSYIIKNNIKIYYDAFDICNDPKNKGEITSFILTFLELLTKAANDLFIKLEDLNGRLAFYLDILSNINLKGKKENLLFVLCQNKLFADKPIRIKELAEVSKMSRTTIRKLLNELCEDDLAVQTKHGREIVYTANLSKLEEFKKTVTE